MKIGAIAIERRLKAQCQNKQELGNCIYDLLKSHVSQQLSEPLFRSFLAWSRQPQIHKLKKSFLA
ncbi:hypothetical protein NIES2098_72580 (plasmid) [Calothrix sp. NIES-2098]|nr:hypothetical protein NIES2098_72580 [Calothrix sp. NIES-2098]